MRQFFLILTALTLFVAEICASNTGSNPKKLSDCDACKIFTESFISGMKKTEEGAFEGGNTAWEEEKLRSYAVSELRLTEILETICSEVTDGQQQCYQIYGDYEDEIEKWWFDLQEKHPNFEKYFCIDKLKRCCLELHYGAPKCLPCPGFPANVCSRKGICNDKGKCICHEGYIGKNCESCSRRYFESFRNGTEFTCSPCPLQCQGTCTKLGCDKCSKGWIKDDNNQCVDIDECLNTEKPCKGKQYCLNMEGSYKCLPCDIACDECTGDGVGNCVRCAIGYELIKSTCIAETQPKQNKFLLIAKILTYVFVSIATGVIYRKGGILAALVALTFTLYTTVIQMILNYILN